MESLDKEWIFHGNVQQCEQFEKTPNTLGLKNMAGVFILVGAGIIGGNVLVGVLRLNRRELLNYKLLICLIAFQLSEFFNELKGDLIIKGKSSI